jgi:hypothetical protein
VNIDMHDLDPTQAKRIIRNMRRDTEAAEEYFTSLHERPRRTVMLWGDGAAGGTQLLLGTLLWTGNLSSWHTYPLLALLSVALAFQRVAYSSAVPQLVPKRYLGHANGIVQLSGGMAQLVVPLVAVGLMAGIGLEGILVVDVVSYAFAVLVTLAVRFPNTMAYRRREPVLTELAEGFTYS